MDIKCTLKHQIRKIWIFQRERINRERSDLEITFGSIVRFELGQMNTKRAVIPSCISSYTFLPIGTPLWTRWQLVTFPRSIEISVANSIKKVQFSNVSQSAQRIVVYLHVQRIIETTTIFLHLYLFNTNRYFLSLNGW